jgi:hypothetical protein
MFILYVESRKNKIGHGSKMETIRDVEKEKGNRERDKNRN